MMASEMADRETFLRTTLNILCASLERLGNPMTAVVHGVLSWVLT